VGSAGFGRSGLYQDLRDAGVHLAAFNTTQGRRNRLQLNFRNHRKIVVVVDGRMAWIGGHNVGDRIPRRRTRSADPGAIRTSAFTARPSSAPS
jgi:phosphatidylserine/phosphatidylglycerophosphate/cardiolipin synthase-like enzyme